MSPAPRPTLPKTTRVWTLGVMAAGLGLVVSVFGYVLVLVGWGRTVPIESGLILFGPYFLCGMTVLFTNGHLSARIFAVLILASGLIMGVLVGWELTDGVVKRGGPPDMLVTVFVGAFVLVGQYLATGLGLLVAWIYWMAPPWTPDRPPTPEEPDYAD